MEVSTKTKFRKVKDKLESGSAVLIFDNEAETTNIFLADDPILKSLMHYRLITRTAISYFKKRGKYDCFRMVG